MSQNARRFPLIAGLASLLLATPLVAQETDEAADESTAEATVRVLYDIISSEAGRVPDWEPVRALFLPEALIILRSSREAMSVLTLDGFIQDFDEFYQVPAVQENGFKETILELKSTEFGDMAQVWVLYEARVPDGGGNRGVDNFSLIRRDGAWRVAAITNEVPFPGRPVPDGLFD
jgi:hypothetical protein